MSSPRCKDCKFWSFYERLNVGVDTEYSRGECRRYPPHAPATASSRMEHGRVWPITTDTDWCGEFQAQTSISNADSAD